MAGLSTLTLQPIVFFLLVNETYGFALAHPLRFNLPFTFAQFPFDQLGERQ
jgi:hypothetical protein